MNKQTTPTPNKYPVLYVPYPSGLLGLIVPASSHQKLLAKLLALNIENSFEDCSKFVKAEIKSGIFKNEKDFMKGHFSTYKTPTGQFLRLLTDNLNLRKNTDAIKILQKKFKSQIKIANVSLGIQVYIDENEQGSETVHEKHKVWS